MPAAERLCPECGVTPMHASDDNPRCWRCHNAAVAACRAARKVQLTTWRAELVAAATAAGMTDGARVSRTVGSWLGAIVVTGTYRVTRGLPTVHFARPMQTSRGFRRSVPWEPAWTLITQEG